MTSAHWLRPLIKGLLRIAFLVYYRSIQVQGIERFPAKGPVLLVANHPSSLLDPAALVYVLSRQVHFGAKHTLFKGPFRAVLEAFGAIPLVRAQDDPRGMGRNPEAFERYAALLGEGRVTAIFPEGLTQDAPHLSRIKTGAARIALQAEAAADFTLQLTVVPVGPQFEPRRRFRADAFLRFGGWDPLPARFTRRGTWAVLSGVLAIGVVTTAVLVVLFISNYGDLAIRGLPLDPSPWQATRTSNPEAAGRELRRDAAGVLSAGQQLDRMQEQMANLRAEFLRGDRDFLTQEDHDEIHALLGLYLELRSVLLKTVWRYRGQKTEAAVTTNDPLEARAFLTAYAAAVLLAEKAWLVYAHQGLISQEQLQELEAELQPGDILIERRNGYVSNSLLPGFWPHAALYLGSYEELVQLGVAMDPRAAPHMLEFQEQDELGDDFAVLEAIGEGVIFTSFEHSVGEADAVAVLRPNVSKEDLRDALGRALSHRGKEYENGGVKIDHSAAA